MILGTILMFSYFLKRIESCIFRGTFATITNIPFIKNSAEGKGRQCTTPWKTMVSFYARAKQFVHCEGPGRARESVQREKKKLYQELRCYGYRFIETCYELLCQVKSCNYWEVNTLKNCTSKALSQFTRSSALC